MKKNSIREAMPYSLKKILKTMRLTLFIYLVGIVQVFALNSYSQQTKLNLNMKNTKLGTVLDEIENQSEFYFLFNEEMVDMQRKVSVTFKGKMITEVLDGLFADTNVKYVISDRQIVLSANDYFWGSTSQQKRKITGLVTDEDGAPLPGVTVFVKETTTGTITDANGNYVLNVPMGKDVLIISFIGMKTQEVTIGSQLEINIKMQADVIGLEEVVAIGYGTVKKSDLTGAVNQVDAKKLEAEATSNISDLLRGNVPGLNINFSTSAKGLSDPKDFMIRGETSVRTKDDDQKKANAPLIVVDGMIYYGDLADINPNDIDKFDILKDASSAAIYGSRASNGVIIITTKRGAKGKPTINVNASVGVAVLSGAQIEPMNGEQFIDWRIAGFESNERHHLDKEWYYRNPEQLPSGITIDEWKAYDGSSGSDDLTQIWLQRLGFSPVEIANYKEGETIKWKDHEFQTGLRQDYNVSLSGSTDVLSYYWSLGYVRNEGIVHNETFETYRSRLNLEGVVTNYLKVGLNTQFAARDESPLPSGTNLTNVPPYSDFYEGDTDIIMYAPSGNISASRHPWLDLTYRERLRKYNSLNSKIYGTLTLPYGFSFTSEFITRFNWNREFNHWSSAHFDWGKEGGRAERSRSNVFEWQVNNILKWNKDFNIHHFDVTLVQNAEKYQYWSEKMRRNQFQPSDVLGYHRMQAATTDVEISSDDQYSTADALLARLNYTLKDRYMFTGSFRRDGYSAFGQKHPRANFGSVALGWIVSEEDFFKVSWLDMLKLRASYGTNGNRAVGRYQALSDLNTGKYVLQFNGTAQYVSQLYVNRMANPDLMWERTGAYNLGIDFSTLNGRLRGNVEAYYMQTKDLLVERKLPDITGFSSVWTNLGQVDNRGIEVVLNSINIDKNDFKWSSSFSMSHNKNEIKHLYGDMEDVLDENGNVVGQKESDDVTNQWFIGHALDQIWNYKVLGIWQEDEREEAAEYSRQPGDYKIWDKNEDGYYTNDDKVFQGYQNPKFRFTLRNDFNYKNWTLSLKMYSYLGYWSANNHLRNNDVFYDRGTSFNVPYWTPENPNNKWARVESYESGFSVYENNSFVRLDNVALTYEVPKSFLNKFQVQRCSFSIVAQNPLVWSPHWSWMDPEKKAYNTPSYYTLKLNLTL